MPGEAKQRLNLQVSGADWGDITLRQLSRIKWIGEQCREGEPLLFQWLGGRHSLIEGAGAKEIRGDPI